VSPLALDSALVSGSDLMPPPSSLPMVSGSFSSVANQQGLELDLVSEEVPTPLFCYPAANSKYKLGSSDWVLQIVMEFSHFVDLWCNGFEGKLSALFADIIASNADQGMAFGSTVGKKGTRELNSQFISSMMKLTVVVLLGFGTRVGPKELFNEAIIVIVERYRVKCW
jgi:hypothetical protein